MPGAFLYADVVGGAAAVATPSVVPPGMPLANLASPQPRMRARVAGPWTDASGGAAGWDVTSGPGFGIAGLEPASTNLQIRSASLTDSAWLLGSNTVALGTVADPAGGLTARRLQSGPSGPASVFLSRAALLGVAPGTSYALSISVRLHSGALGVGRLLTVEHRSETGAFLRRAFFMSMLEPGAGMVPPDASWRRYSAVLTIPADTASIQVFYASDWTPGAVIDVAWPQIEARAVASGYIATAAVPVARAVTAPWSVLRFDLGAARAMDCLALVSTSLTAGARVRVRLSTADVTGNAGDAWDTGVQDAATTADANGNVVLIRAAPATGRYLLVEVHDPSGTPVDIGRIVAGPLWRLARAHAYGIEEGSLMLDRRERNELTGAEFAVPAIANPRSARFTLPVLTAAEAKGEHRALVRHLGAVRDALWLPDLALFGAERNQRSLFGAVNAPGGPAAAAHASFGAHSREFTLVERL